MNDPIKLALVDDESLFLEGLVLLLSGQEHINVVTKTNSATDLLELLSNLEEEQFPDIVLVDIQMKPVNGFELVEILKEKHPELKIIILSSHYKKSVLGHMIKLGVSAFIPKDARKNLLLETIKSVFLFGVYFSPQDQKMIMSYMNDKPKKPILSSIDELSAREIEVLKLICKEKTNQEIADQLFISKRTVESHRQRILDKVGAKNTVGLVVYAIANQIHPLPEM